MEGGGARAHSPELVVARVRSRVLAVVRGRLSHGAPFSFVGVPLRSWAVISVRARSVLFVRVCFHLCVCLFVRASRRCTWCALGWSCAVGRVRSMVDERGGGWATGGAACCGW